MDQHRRAAESTNVAARTLGLHTHVIHASTERNFDAAFATLLQVHAGALRPIRFFLSQRDQLATLAVQHGVPASYNLREFAKADGLTSYGTSVTEASRQAGLFARLGSAHEKRLRHRSASLTPTAPSSPAAAGCAGSIEEKSMYS